MTTATIRQFRHWAAAEQREAVARAHRAVAQAVDRVLRRPVRSKGAKP